MKRLILFSILFIFILPLIANNLFLVENPTAGILSRGEARINMKVFQNNGFLIGADVGLFDNFQFGLSVGGNEIVGRNEPEFNKVDYKAKFRIFNETLMFPAIAIGVDTQGHGRYFKEQNRYDIMSKGAYLVASKNYSLLGLFGFDIGFNYTFEDTGDFNDEYDIFAGIYKTLGENLILFADFSAGLNDRKLNNEEDIYDILTRRRGFLNTGVEFQINDQLTIKFLMHDLFRNKHETKYFDRSILIDYRWFF